MVKSFGSRLAAARKAVGLNQTQVAERLTAAGYPVRTQAVSKWERDTTLPSALQLVELCRIYRIRDVVAAFAPAEETGAPARILPLYHLAVPAGTSVRFEPGIAMDVELVAFAGEAVTAGFRGLYAPGAEGRAS